MSNEPKWTETNGVIYYNHEEKKEAYTALDDADQAKGICDTLNRLESEVEHSEVLRNSLDRLLSNEVEHRRKLESEVERLKELIEKLKSLGSSENFPFWITAYNLNDKSQEGKG